MIPEIHAYLAGPDVFYPNGKEIGEKLKARLAEAGIVGHYPFDNEIQFGDPAETANAIGKANEGLMLGCCEAGRFGIIFANMTPYRGPSMDVGTAFEVGFMSALAEVKDNILIIGYTEDPRSFEERVINDYYKGQKITKDENGILRAPDTLEVEAYGGAENLMLTQAIHKTGGFIAKSLDEAVAGAREIIETRFKNTLKPLSAAQNRPEPGQ
ncbi:MAG: nucleoside 2-deoxyribosyltransferase [Alphaproteobacteria bacterium]|nr:nucleoside 2-deoxyribosyltransferase [Alphaproteobacteria bacterium]